jgi:hypothetical protein
MEEIHQTSPNHDSFTFPKQIPSQTLQERRSNLKCLAPRFSLTWIEGLRRSVEKHHVWTFHALPQFHRQLIQGLPQQCNPIDLTTHHFAIYHVQISWSCTSGDRQLAISARLAFFNPRSSAFLKVTYERVRWHGVGQNPLSSILDTIWLWHSQFAMERSSHF